MAKIILYHGSSEIVQKPIFGKGKIYNDYGQGFYLTEHVELAKEWACGNSTDGYVNKYELDLDGLSILNLSDKKYNILNWLAILLENRKMNLNTPTSSLARDYILENFLPEYKKYDIIIGYRADDSYFAFVRSFVANSISLKQLSKAMRLGKLGEQIVLMSEKAFKNIKYIGYEDVNSNIYYEKRKLREENAKKEYLEELEKEDLNGIFIRDLIRENIKDGDSRIR